MSKHAPTIESPKPAKRTLTETDIDTQPAEPKGPLTVRTEVRAGIHGSDFNAPRGR